ncbi:hypothetical protein PHLCEN_2v13512 [Hermanssonia centrifuga]|uniref:Uncharacterized protein n=1 Tax=Hermanssonia centrifuga TaxID=98765 RepID=A0A2R6NE14_9APHY|nr:hypothetical protein PHLCEN_2v13512 [Hermanssonia centrifuga]
MDELYNNAWGEPPKDPPRPASESSATVQTTWTSPKLSLALHNDEADLAAPSWSTGAEIKWDEPSDSHGFAWSSTEPDLAWGASTYHDIPLGVTPDTLTVDKQLHDEEGELDTTDESTAVSVNPTSSRPSSPHLESYPTTTQSRSESSGSPSPDEDEFGTFETPTEEQSNSFPSAISPEIEADDWESPWIAQAEGSEETAGPADEWEIARKRKERLDRKVPPEVLSSILIQCTEYCQEVWPDSKEETPGQALDWTNGLESIEGLEVLVKSIVPDLTLEPPVQFSKTSTAKNLGTAVRLTKNLQLSKTSPLSYYLAARGSTAWETALKERKIVVEEDVVPIGWRILEKQSTTKELDTVKSTKSTGGLFSFWGRRQSKTMSPSPSSDSPAERSPSPAMGSPTAVSGDVGVSSVRPSQDSIRSLSGTQTGEKPSVSLVTIPPLQEPSISSTNPSSPASYSEAPDPHTDRPGTPPSQAPSGVSRFFSRFSRRQSGLSTSSSRGSFALSSDDLEFLSDIVPSAHDDNDDDGEAQLKGLSNILKPEPLPPVLPPPPTLLPPPAPLPSRTQGTTTRKITPPLGDTTLIPTFSTSSTPAFASQVQGEKSDDLFGLFEASSPGSPVSHVSPLVASFPPHSGVSTLQPATSSSLSNSSAETASPPLSKSTLMPSVRSVTQPGLLPPPPSSRSHTPVTLTRPSSSTTRSASEAGTSSQRARSPPLRPKIPLSFTVPSPSSSSSSPPPTASSVLSTQSEVPLGELYPGAVVRGSTSQASTPVSRSSSPFLLPRPPSNLPFSSVMSSSSTTRPAPSPPLIAPPPAPSHPTAPSSSKSLIADDDFDDFDDFADFQSSDVISGPSLPASQPTLSSNAFSLQPPPRLQAAALRALAPIAPPSFPVTSPSSMHLPATPQARSVDPFSEDISFMSSPASANITSGSSRTSGLNSSFPSNRALLTPQKDRSFDFGEMADSLSALRTPSPPRPPTKSPRPLQPSSSPPREKKVNATQHQHTLSLMERAAARPGQWPAPPSPLPEAISFPVLGHAPKQSIDFMNDDDSFGTFQSEGMLPSASSPTLLKPATISLPPSFPFTKSLHPAPSMVHSMTTSKDSGASQVRGSINAPKGVGLSAQDLSFFEGL